MRRDIFIGYQPIWALFIIMPFEPITTTISNRWNIHRDTDTFECPLVSIRKQIAGQFKRLLYSYATMRQRSTITLENTSIICIVEIYREIIGESEYDATKGVTYTSFLTDSDIA